MKRVSYQTLKRYLSKHLNEAAAGEEILVTRHEKPVAILISAEREGLTVGRRFGVGAPAPLFVRKTKGRYLDSLVDDRRGGRDR